MENWLIILLCIAWYAIGVCSFSWFIWNEDEKITLSDLILIILIGITGLIGPIIVIIISGNEIVLFKVPATCCY